MALISSRTTGCPLCGASACGCTSPDYHPREHVIEMEDLTMTAEQQPKKLAHYEVEHDNGTVATYKMTEEDAKRIGAKKRSTATSSSSTGSEPATKARTAPNK